MAEKNNSNNEILEEMRKFKDNFSKLQSELAVTKCVNTELTMRIVIMERQCWANAQYSRKECLKVAGILRQVDDNQLEIQFSRRLAAQLTLVSLMTVTVLARIMTELLSRLHAERIVNKFFKSKKP